MMTLPAHSHIGASSMKRWMLCPGSVRMSRGIPSVSSPYADEGTRAHELAARILLGEEGQFGFGEMFESVSVYVQYISEIKKKHPDAVMLVEKKFNLEAVHPGLFGTADCVIYIPSDKLLMVIDYKHGAGVAVDVQDNPQLFYYALGALISTRYPCRSVKMSIVQPRCAHPDGPIRSQVIDAIDLLDFAADLKAFAIKTEDPNAPLVPGKEQCFFCPAKAICPALHQMALEASVLEFRPTLSYDPEILSETLNKLPAIEAWVKGVREFAYREAEHGRCPPGFKLVNKRASRQWADEAQAIYACSHNPDLFESSLKSVAQVEKILGKKEFEQKLGSHVVSVSSGLTLAPVSDKRQAALCSAASEFTKIENDEKGETIYE